MAHCSIMLCVNLKGQKSTSIHSQMLKTIFGPIFVIWKDILMRLTPFCTVSQCSFHTTVLSLKVLELLTLA